MTESFRFDGRLRSVGYALRGCWAMLRTQHNAWVHAVATVVVIITGAFFHVAPGEWCWLILAIMAVWTAEALNTALELLADAASPEFNPLVGQAKDVAAGAVLISAVGSVAIGALVFGPHLMRVLEQGS